MQLSPQFLEVVNGMRLILCIALMFLFGRYIWLEFQRQLEAIDRLELFFPPGIEDAVYQTCHNRRAAISVFVLLSGEGMVALAVWSWRHFELPTSNLFVAWGAGAGIILFILGASCAIRAFAPERWHGWRPWYVIPTTAAIVSVALAL